MSVHLGASFLIIQHLFQYLYYLLRSPAIIQEKLVLTLIISLEDQPPSATFLHIGTLG